MSLDVFSNGDYNCSFGMYSQQYNKTGSMNTTVGAYALCGVKDGNVGNHNVSIGYGSMSDSSGIYCSRNTCIGASAGAKLTGQNNVLIGYATGYNITSGIGNIFIGYSLNESNTNYKLNIGDLITGNLNADTGKYVKINGGLDLSDIPTINPNIKGRVWNDNGTLKISTGA